MVSDPGHAGLQALLGIEDEARLATDRAALLRSLVNAPRQLLGYRQAIVLMAGRGGVFKAEAVTSLPAVDRSAPLIRWFEALASRAATEMAASGPTAFQLPAFCNPSDPDTLSYPFKQFLFVPIRLPGAALTEAPIGIWLCAREQSWNDGDVAVAERLAGTYAHALRALQPARNAGFGHSGRSSRRAWWLIRSLAVVALAMAAFMPVPLSALAPVEVSASSARIVSAGADGIVADVLVDPGETVVAGQVLAKLDQVDLLNRLDVAERNIEVAEAKLWRSTQAAFGSVDAKRELAISRSELRVAQAERDALLAEQKRTILEAPAGGIVIFKDKRELLGKPVAVGQKLMQVASPESPEFRIDLPVSDVMLLETGAPVRVFLDSDPLNPLDAILTRTSYHARATSEGVLAYSITAKPSGSDVRLRVGARGSAKLIGDDVPLYFFLLRKPIAAIRQWTGW